MIRILFTIFAVCMILHSKVLAAEETIFPGEFWEECSPEEQGVDSTSLDEAMQYLGDFIHAKEKVKRALVIRNGYIIWKGADIDSINCVFSISKAFASTVLGHLIDAGKCSLETLAKDCVSLDLSDYPNVNLFHLSTMTSGYSSEGPTWIRNGISTPFKPTAPHFEPGEYFEYSDHAMHLFGYVLTMIAGQNLEVYFRNHIARLIGIKDSEWYWETGWAKCKVDNSNPDYADVRSAATGLWISAQALARFGYLFLNNGKWNDKQILSAKWVKSATTVQVPETTPPFGKYGKSRVNPVMYGFNWWINGIGGLHKKRRWSNAPPNTYAAIGAHHNWCWVIPEWDMIIVRIGTDNPRYLGNSDKRYDTFFLKLTQSIIDKSDF